MMFLLHIQHIFVSLNMHRRELQKKPLYFSAFVQTKRLHHFKSSYSSTQFILSRKKLVFLHYDAVCTCLCVSEHCVI